MIIIQLVTPFGAKFRINFAFVEAYGHACMEDGDGTWVRMNSGEVFQFREQPEQIDAMLRDPQLKVRT